MILEQMLEEPQLFLNNREDNVAQHAKSWNGEHTYVRFGIYVNPKAQLGSFANGGVRNVRESSVFEQTKSDLIIVKHKDLVLPKEIKYYNPPTIEAMSASLAEAEKKKPIKLIDVHDTYKTDRYKNLYSGHTTVAVRDESNAYLKLSMDLEIKEKEFKLCDTLVRQKKFDTRGVD